MYSFFEKIEILGLVILKMILINLPALMIIIMIMIIVTKISGDKSFFRKIIYSFFYK